MSLTDSTPTRPGLTRDNWRFNRAYTAFFFAHVPGDTISRPDLPEVLCGFGPMFTRQLVPGWTFKRCVEECEERVSHMRERNIPHDAFAITCRPYGSPESFKDSQAITGIVPSIFARTLTRDVIRRLTDAGLVFIVPYGWNSGA